MRKKLLNARLIPLVASSILIINRLVNLPVIITDGTVFILLVWAVWGFIEMRR